MPTDQGHSYEMSWFVKKRHVSKEL